MKRLICIVLICWLPLFAVTANALSLQMTMANQQSEATQASQMACHEDVHQHPSQQHASHNCALCGFCTVVTSAAIFSFPPLLHMHATASAKPIFVEVTFNSLPHPPVIKPPISA
ncbi:MAG: hypothetical protein SFU55_00050 [Methylophilus sp.]|nr:hypothetical protein [Methylophilus sp.]